MVGLFLRSLSCILQTRNLDLPYPIVKKYIDLLFIVLSPKIPVSNNLISIRYTSPKLLTFLNFQQDFGQLLEICIFVVVKLLYRLQLLFLIRLIPLGTVDNNLGPDRLEGPKALETRSHILHTTNPLIASLLSGSPYCVWY